MASPTVYACSCSDGGDDALSTTANVLSILTFAYILIIGSLYQLRYINVREVIMSNCMNKQNSCNSKYKQLHRFTRRSAY